MLSINEPGNNETITGAPVDVTAKGTCSSQHTVTVSLYRKSNLSRVLAQNDVTANSSTDWSTTFTGLAAGEYSVSATCQGQDTPVQHDFTVEAGT